MLKEIKVQKKRIEIWAFFLSALHLSLTVRILPGTQNGMTHNVLDTLWLKNWERDFTSSCHRTISSTTLRADWSISSWTNERQRQARACCLGSSWTISSPYRYTPMAWSTHTQSVYFPYYPKAPLSGWIRDLKVFHYIRQDRCSTGVCIYLIMDQKVFHISVGLSVCMFDHQLTPAMSDLEAKTEEKIQQLLIVRNADAHLITLNLTLRWKISYVTDFWQKRQHNIINMDQHRTKKSKKRRLRN